MFVIDDAKLPPPRPASAAHTAQLRPPNFAVANVYGKRRHAPTSVAVAASKNLSPAEKPYTDAGMNSTITDQIDQIEKPTCSAITDQIRLRRAILLLPSAHAAVSSGSQSKRTCERPFDILMRLQ